MSNPPFFLSSSSYLWYAGHILCPTTTTITVIYLVNNGYIHQKGLRMHKLGFPFPRSSLSLLLPFNSLMVLSHLLSSIGPIGTSKNICCPSLPTATYLPYLPCHSSRGQLTAIKDLIRIYHGITSPRAVLGLPLYFILRAFFSVVLSVYHAFSILWKKLLECVKDSRPVPFRIRWYYSIYLTWRWWMFAAVGIDREMLCPGMLLVTVQLSPDIFQVPYMNWLE